MVAKKGEQHRGGILLPAILELNGLGKRQGDFLRYLGHISQFRDPWQNNSEFIAAETSHSIGIPCTLGQFQGHRFQETIAGLMSQGIVDIFKDVFR